MALPFSSVRSERIRPGDVVIPIEHLAQRLPESALNQVEDYPNGLPRFSSLIGSHTAFRICRRFSTVRARLLILKQDKVCLLESRLNELDARETRPLFLGSSRRDKNLERAKVLEDLDIALRDLDDFVQRACTVSEMMPAPKNIIVSLRNWVEGNGCIAREETEYLDCERDLFTTNSYGDSAMNLLLPFVARVTVIIWKFFGKRLSNGISRDENVFIFSQSALHLATRTLIAWIVVILLPVPIVVMQAIKSLVPRVLCTVFALLLLILSISYLSNARTAEIFIAGATYATVLVVFLSNETET